MEESRREAENAGIKIDPAEDDQTPSEQAKDETTAPTSEQSEPSK